MKRMALALIGLLLLSEGAAASLVRITSRDGTVFVGNLDRREGGFYTVRTPYGIVTIPETSVVSVTPVEPDSPGGQIQAPTSFAGTVRFAGSNTIGAELAPQVVEEFARVQGLRDIKWRAGANSEERVLSARLPNGSEFVADFKSHGSNTALKALGDKTAEFGMMSRRMTPEEVRTFSEKGLGDFTQPQQEHVVALDGLIIMVHPQNPVTRFTMRQLTDVFSGKINDWAALGGRAGPITVYGRDAKSGTWDTFRSLVLGKEQIVASAKRFESSSDLSDAVSADPQGIGFVGFAYARNTKVLEIAGDCGIFAPSREFFVKTEEYPLSRRLYLYTHAETSPLVSGVLNFALSGLAQPVVSKAQFINLLPELVDASYGAARSADARARATTRPDLLAELDRVLLNGRRVSVTFRFRSGSATLDNRAIRDVDRLAAFMRDPGNAGKRVALLGFADSRGSFPQNLRLSRERAAAVQRALQGKNLNAAYVSGFSEHAPVVCEDDQASEGAEKNRRVEVWIY